MRKVININSGWEFVREGLTENVDLPHTWNGIDGQGGADSYYRGKCVYRRMPVSYTHLRASTEGCCPRARVGASLR